MSSYSTSKTYSVCGISKSLSFPAFQYNVIPIPPADKMSPGSSGKDLQAYTLPQRTTLIIAQLHCLPKNSLLLTYHLSSWHVGDSGPQCRLESMPALLSRQLWDGKIQEKTKKRPTVEAGGPENTPALQGPTTALLTQLLVSYSSLYPRRSGSAEGDSSIPTPQTPPQKGTTGQECCLSKPNKMYFIPFWLLWSSLLDSSHAR